LLSVLVDRMFEAGRKRPEALTELVDVLFALTGIAFYRELTARRHESGAVFRIIQALAADAVQRTLSEMECKTG
jgi:hypothetical protein